MTETLPCGCLVTADYGHVNTKFCAVHHAEIFGVDKLRYGAHNSTKSSEQNEPSFLNID